MILVLCLDAVKVQLTTVYNGKLLQRPLDHCTALCSPFILFVALPL